MSSLADHLLTLLLDQRVHEPAQSVTGHPCVLFSFPPAVDVIVLPADVVEHHAVPLPFDCVAVGDARFTDHLQQHREVGLPVRDAGERVSVSPATTGHGRWVSGALHTAQLRPLHGVGQGQPACR